MGFIRVNAGLQQGEFCLGEFVAKGDISRRGASTVSWRLRVRRRSIRSENIAAGQTHKHINTLIFYDFRCSQSFVARTAGIVVAQP